jgi:hypothetical protein
LLLKQQKRFCRIPPINEPFVNLAVNGFCRPCKGEPTVVEHDCPEMLLTYLHRIRTLSQPTPIEGNGRSARTGPDQIYTWLVLFAGPLFCPICSEHFMYSWIRSEMQWRHQCHPGTYLRNCRVNRGEWSTGNFKFVFNETKGASDAFNFMNMHFPLKVLVSIHIHQV